MWGLKTTLMKGKIFLLLGIGFLPLALKGQTYLYNKGTMSVVTTDNTKTALYIGGNFITEANATATGVMHLKKAKVVLTGDMYRVGSAATSSHVFDVGDYLGYGTEADRSKFVFRGTAAQNVWRATTATLANTNVMDFKEKPANVIYFPDIVIENSKHVTIHPEIAASAYDVKPINGRLILDSRKLASTDKMYVTGSSIHNTDNSSILAHLKLNGKHDAGDSFKGKGASRTLDSYGGVQVNLALDKIKGEGDRLNYGDAIVGMGVPFNEMRADYFMYNFLFMPSGNSIFNADRNTTTDPTLALKAGQGFVVGIDLRGGNSDNYPDIHYLYNQNGLGVYKLDFSKRVTEKYQFNRLAYGANPNNLYQLASTVASDGRATNTGGPRVDGLNISDPASTTTGTPYSKELLSGGADAVTRPLVQGFNYLSNPFTCPIDVSELLNDGTQAAGWGVTPTYTLTGSSSGDIANRVWVMDPFSAASGTYNFINPTEKWPGNKWVIASYQYRLITNIAATNSNPYDNGEDIAPSANSSALIAPLQMFVVYSRVGNKNITIPASARKIDENALFLRSSEVTYAPDDFLFEVLDESSGKADRTAVVLRTFSEIGQNNYTDTKKLRTTVSAGETGETRASTTEGDISPTYMSTLYTKNTDGSALESRFLSLDLNSSTTSTTLYLTPSLQEQEITIRSFRNYTKERISEIWLDDIKTGNKVKLSGGDVYKTKSSPTDDPARFTLRFIYPAGGIGEEVINPDETDITAYYANSILTVSGFNDLDYGSLVSVYDIQGRLVKQSKVDGASVVFRDGFTVGAYIVKVTGHRSHVTKFLAR